MRVIGLTGKDPNNSLEQVEKFVAGKGDGIGYAVAFDADRKTNEAYMEAAGERGILVGRPFPPMLNHLRVSIGTEEEMALFVAAFREIFAA